MRSLLGFTTLPSALLCALAGCASGVTADPADDPADGTATEAASNDAYTYFAIRSDLRKCGSPACGGWFLSRVNRTTTPCHDGRIAASCYTPVLDWSQAGLSDDQQAAMLRACSQSTLSADVYAVVRGQFARRNTTTPRPDLGRFVITEAWLAEGDAASAGAFVKLHDNGLRCFAPPCPSITELTLNLGTTTDIAGIDWTPSGMSDDLIAECTGDLATADGLLVVGDPTTMIQNGTAANGRTVTVAYQRLTPQ
jgi:hypothetical protein